MVVLLSGRIKLIISFWLFAAGTNSVRFLSLWFSMQSVIFKIELTGPLTSETWHTFRHDV